MNPASLRGTRRESNPLRLNIAKVHVPLSAVLAAWLGRKLGHSLTGLLRLLLVHPWLVVVALIAWLVGRLVGRLVDAHGVAALLALFLVVTALLLAVLTAVLVVWRHLRRESFTRSVVWRLRGSWRARVVYRGSWVAAMTTIGLGVGLEGRDYLPRLRRVSSTGTVDRVEVAMLPGQVFEDWTGVAPRLAQTFGAQDCRVRTTRHRQRLELWFLIRDPLTDPVQPLAPATSRDGSVDLATLPVALGEDGTTYRVRLLGTHVLIVGATGSGKGSVIWSTLHALGPAIRDGLVAVWCLDPKGGMELAPGRGLFARFVYGDPDENLPGGTDGGTGGGLGGVGGGSYELEFARVLEDAVAVMRRRQSALRGKARLHTPSVAEPLVLVVVDEIASLTAYVVDRDAKRRIAAALSLLLSQGRAVGVSVVGAVQDPRKEVVTVRDLFPTRIALRLSEPEHVGLVLGQGARDRGARCDQIPESLPGVGYVGVDGRAEPVRVRFGHVTDDHIAALARDYGPRPQGAVAAHPVDSMAGDTSGAAA